MASKKEGIVSGARPYTFELTPDLRIRGFFDLGEFLDGIYKRVSDNGSPLKTWSCICSVRRCEMYALRSYKSPNMQLQAPWAYVEWENLGWRDWA
jgi:hypothetical protein